MLDNASIDAYKCVPDSVANCAVGLASSYHGQNRVENLPMLRRVEAFGMLQRGKAPCTKQITPEFRWRETLETIYEAPTLSEPPRHSSTSFLI
jgi:hypothetical protein